MKSIDGKGREGEGDGERRLLMISGERRGREKIIDDKWRKEGEGE